MLNEGNWISTGEECIIQKRLEQNVPCNLVPGPHSALRLHSCFQLTADHFPSQQAWTFQWHLIFTAIHPEGKWMTFYFTPKLNWTHVRRNFKIYLCHVFKTIHSGGTKLLAPFKIFLLLFYFISFHFITFKCLRPPA